MCVFGCCYVLRNYERALSVLCVFSFLPPSLHTADQIKWTSASFCSHSSFCLLLKYGHDSVFLFFFGQKGDLPSVTFGIA